MHGQLTRYTVSGGSVVVKARSSIHDTETRWQSIAGSVEADPETLSETGATATISVDMTAFDAGDWLKNRKLKKDLAVDKHPSAEFSLNELTDVVRQEDGTFQATAHGVIRWRNREAPVVATGSGVVASDRIEAVASFDLDVTTLGVTPPKILMFKVEKVVSVEVTINATSSSS